MSADQSFDQVEITYDNIVAAAEEPELFGKIIMQLLRAGEAGPVDGEVSYHLGDLGLLYQTRFERKGTKADIEPTIKYFADALVALPQEHPYRPGYVVSLASAYAQRYDTYGDIHDLEKTLQYAQSSVDATPDDDPELPGRLNNLATGFRSRYLRFGDIADHDSAIHYNMAAVNMVSSDNPDLPKWQQSLAATYLDRYQRLGQSDDLENARHYNELALKATPSHDHFQLPIRQQALAVVYRECYWAFGHLVDLESALKYDEAALSVAPITHSYINIFMENASISYCMRYQRFGDLKDLEHALSYGQKVIDVTSEEDLDFALRCQNLAIFYRERYQQFKKSEDLLASLKYDQQALDATPVGHPLLPVRQNNTAVSCLLEFDRLGDKNALEKAINLLVQALDNTPSGHNDISSRHYNLAVAYHQSHSKLTDSNSNKYASDLELSILHHHTAVNVDLVNKSILLPKHQHMLGNTYHTLFHYSGDSSDLHCALFYCEIATQSTVISPPTLWLNAKAWGFLAHKYNLQDCLKAYYIAFSTLPDLLWLGSALNVRQSTLVKYETSDLTASAVAAALQFGKYELAVEFLEQGLAISHRQMLELRDESIELQEAFPDVAKQLKDLSLQLQHYTTQASPLVANEVNMLQAKHQHDSHAAAIQRNNLIKEIRELPGFREFFLPLPYKKIASAAQEGPVIMLNCSEKRGDAIILLCASNPVQCVSLPGVTLKTTQSMLKKLRLALEIYNIHSRQDSNHKFYTDRLGQPFEKSPEKAQGFFREVLSWLWKMVVQPVFSILQNNNISSGRIWWCPSGPFTYLPLHAAGIHGPYIHSYTSTLNSLLQGRAKYSASLNSSGQDILTAIGVSQVKDKSYMTLPSVDHELEKIATICQAHQVIQLMDNQATVGNVLDHIKQAKWVHLACHGQQNHEDPLKSGLHLYDGTLELGKILESNLPSAEFVFLSACQTAMGDAKLMNESMHLAGGFIAAGFQGSIGTLWNMADSDGPRVTELVYQEIFGSQETPDVTRAARALHIAVQKLKREGAPFQRWMPFIHMGI